MRAQGDSAGSFAATRAGAVAAAIALLVTLGLAGCGSSGTVNAALAGQPIPAGKARLTIRRPSAILYAAAPATITIDGKQVADVGSGGAAIVDIPEGARVVAASAWSYPGAFKVRLTATAGQTYTIEVAPRAASFGPGTLLGPLGGVIDASVNENAGAFQMRFVKAGTG